MNDISKFMRQAQAMQARIAEAQQKLETMEVEGSAGGGMVRVKMNGKNVLLAVSIDRSLLTPDEGEILEDLVKAAHEDARRKLDEAQQDEFKSATAGLGLPGFKMPF